MHNTGGLHYLKDVFINSNQYNKNYNVEGYNLNSDESRSELLNYLETINEEEIETGDEFNYKISQIIKQDSRMLSLDEAVIIFNWIKNLESSVTVRYFSSIYFSIYHWHKFKNFINNTSYLNYVMDLLFDESIYVFNSISLLHYIDTKPLLNKILKDERINNWVKLYNENDQNKQIINYKIQMVNLFLRQRIDANPNDCYDTNFSSGSYVIELLSIDNILNQEITNIQQIIPTPFKYRKYIYIKTTIYNNENDYNNDIISSSLSNELRKSTLQTINNDVLLIKILDLVCSFYLNPLNYNYSRSDKKSSEISLVDIGKLNIDLSMVSKRFFKLYSITLNKYHFPWYDEFNINNDWCLIKKPPLFINYHSIKYIPYNNFKNYFSRVKHLYIHSDEICNLKQYKQSFKHAIYDIRFVRSVTMDWYLTYLPFMPKLQSITIKKYLGITNSLENLIINIITNCTNRNSLNYFHLEYKNIDCGESEISKSLKEYHKSSKIVINKK